MSEQSGAARPLWRVEDLKGLTVGARDGDIGSVETVYFEDLSWTLRYFVVDTGGWLPGREVLIAPRSIERIDGIGRRLVTNLTKDQVRNSPEIDTRKPVSRQHEIAFYDYYEYPYYWTGPYRWGLWPDTWAAPLAPPVAPFGPEGRSAAVAEELAARERATADPHLRSAGEVSGYGIEATDGSLGHVEDFLVEEQSWAIRYLIVDPQSWWPGKHVVISPDWITRVDWDESKVHVSVTREAVRNAPEYDPAGPVEREWEARLYGHYGRSGYWDRSAEAWRLPPAA
jgi:hypothetical protein